MRKLVSMVLIVVLLAAVAFFGVSLVRRRPRRRCILAWICRVYTTLGLTALVLALPSLTKSSG